jgi:hypothetical protein
LPGARCRPLSSYLCFSEAGIIGTCYHALLACCDGGLHTFFLWDGLEL